MIQDSFYPDVWIHLKCLNSDKAKQWREKRRSEDSEYNRYIELVSDAALTKYSHCGHDNILCVKAVQPIWEMNCYQCHRVNLNGLSPYIEDDRRLYIELYNMRELYLHNSSEPAITKIQATMEALASEYDNYGKCQCGGIYSILAEPRCTICNEIVLDSYFHYVAPETGDLLTRS